MSNKIVIAGAGHGGIVAATKLSAKGYDVTIFEKNIENGIGHDQSDYFDLDSLAYAHIPVPKTGVTNKVPITFVPNDPDVEPITQSVGDDCINLCVDRKEFLAFLIARAKQAGVKFEFDCAVSGPIFFGSRVCGLKTAKGDFFADLVIDACGLYSPVRSQLPEYMNIENSPGSYDVLHTYRAYYNKVEGMPDPEHMYKVYLTTDGAEGLQWVVTDEEYVDVLIGRFHPITQEEINETFESMRSDNPHLGTTVVKGGKIIDIPVRQPLPVLVADGYAAIGDSAFMTIAIKGSGIGYNLRAGTILANAIENDKDGKFSKESLWEYETEFYKEIGFSACNSAVIKNLFPFLKASEVSYVFKEKILSNKDMNLSGDSKGIINLISSTGFSVLADKAKKIMNNQEIKKKITDIAVWEGKLKLLLSSFPSTYNKENVEKWVNKYNTFFSEIKKSDAINDN